MSFLRIKDSNFDLNEYKNEEKIKIYVLTNFDIDLKGFKNLKEIEIIINNTNINLNIFNSEILETLLLSVDLNNNILLKDLNNLKKLTIKSSEYFEDVITEEMSNLEIINCNNIENISMNRTTFVNNNYNLSDFKKLKELKIQETNINIDLENLNKDIESIFIIKSNINSGSNLSNFKKLKELKIQETNINIDIEKLNKGIEILHLDNIKDSLNSKIIFPRLNIKELNISNSEIKILDLNNLIFLEELKIKDFYNLEELYINKLYKLKKLTIFNTKLKSLKINGKDVEFNTNNNFEYIDGSIIPRIELYELMDETESSRFSTYYEEIEDIEQAIENMNNFFKPQKIINRRRIYLLSELISKDICSICNKKVNLYFKLNIRKKEFNNYNPSILCCC